MWCLVIPAAILAAFVFHAPPVIVYVCLKLDQPCKATVAFLKVNKGKWIRDLTVEDTKQTQTIAE